MIQTKIVKYDRSNDNTFEEQINRVLEEISREPFIANGQPLNDEVNTIKDVKVINEQKVIIMYDRDDYSD
ncbi:hypothetical protein WKW47_07290 [Staphylococcus nepalensis]|uniref:hypothetical protein n=1 Tax=Staphylococcus TaxID=1279 RepID=UPI002B25BE90|nr:hypothetical protein [Staphylococcus nepalensis]WQL19479.1 hypothetical protein P3T86_09795 [Staphylococcus nepalensis]